MAARANFEIQALHDDHWITEEIRETESAARAVAKGIFSNRQCQGVRILKNWTRSDGVVTESVVYTETRDTDEMRVTISPIDEAPYCQRTTDYYRLESRTTINRLFRKYLEKVYLTPTELIHSYKSLRKVQEVETLFPTAVDRVATIQARSVGAEPRTRRDEVYSAVAKMTQKARRAEENPNLPTLNGSDFARIVDRVERFAPPDEVDYYSLVVLSQDLMQRRNWLGKLERLVELTNPDLRSEVLGLIDGVIADLVGVPTALQDVLGYQRNLAQALCAIADLCEGRFASARSDATGPIAVLNPLLADGRLEETRRSLLDRLMRQLSGGQALDRTDPSREREAFSEVAQRVFRPEGFLGGAEMAAALTRRFVFLQEAGGMAGLRNAAAGVIATMPDSLFRVVYLTELAASSLGPDLAADIASNLSMVVGAPDIGGLAPPGWPPKDKLLRVTRIYERIEAAQALPDELRLSLLRTLDGLLVDYIRQEGIIERMDSPDAPLRDRARRLLEFCAARILPTGSQAHRLARQRVVDLLKQPNFEMRYVDGVSDPKRAEEMLRQLHLLLGRGGFG